MSAARSRPRRLSDVAAIERALTYPLREATREALEGYLLIARGSVPIGTAVRRYVDLVLDEYEPRTMSHATARELHLDLLRRALDLATLPALARDAFQDMLEEMTTEVPRRCAHDGRPKWRQHELAPKQVKWVCSALGEEMPEPDTRLTSGDIPRGREVAPMFDTRLPMRPPNKRSGT